MTRLAVAEHLHFEMARAREEALKIERTIAEGRLGFGLRGVKLMFEAGLIVRDANAATATTGACFKHDRKADRAGRGQRLIDVGDLAFATRHHRHAGSLCGRARRRLVAHHPDRVGAWPDENEPRRGDGVNETRILGQKAIARMDRAGTGLLRGRNDRIDVQVALAGGRRSDVDGLVGKTHGEALFIGVAEDRDGAQIEFFCRADDPHGNLAAIGD